MTVLSLFDGMSCGQIALRELGIKVDKYYASEIDKYAIAQTQLNFPATVQLGDVASVNLCTPPIYVDLVIGGSPCQGFSFAGKQLNFNDPRSKLFFEFVRILREIQKINPDVKFLLENVRMKKDYMDIISDTLGLQPVVINSALVSAQNRVRIYWTNIRTRQTDLFGTLQTDIPQPSDRGLYLRDILEPEVDERYFLPPDTLANLKIHKERNKGRGNNFGITVRHLDEKSMAVTVKGKGMYDIVAVPVIVQRPRTVIQLNPSRESGSKQPYQQNRVYSPDGLSPALCSAHAGSAPTIYIEERLRRLTPTECARLQTIPEWYKWNCSASQQYKMLGNGWTVEVIKHIFSFL